MLTRSLLFVISSPYDTGTGVFCGVGVGVRTGVEVGAGVFVVVGFCVGFLVAGVGEGAAEEAGAVVFTVFDAAVGVSVCTADPVGTSGTEGEAAAVCAAGAEDAAGSGAGSSLPQEVNKKRNSKTIHKDARQILLRCFFILRFLSLLP